MTNKELLEDLLIEFDELDMQPMLTVPNPLERAKEWKHELTYAIRHLKAEVAREIFGEIKYNFEDLRKVEYANPPLQVVFNLLDYLEKKYTEGEK